MLIPTTSLSGQSVRVITMFKFVVAVKSWIINLGLMTRSSKYKKWENRRYSSPAPNFVKHSVLLRNCFPNAVWVETGTYFGETTEMLSKLADEVYSIEPDPLLFQLAIKKFKLQPNVKIIKGLSEETLPSLLPNLSGKINFYLDGHYSGGDTFQGPKDTPIIDELNCISRNLKRFDDVCIMIDDVRCFNPNISQYSSYPSLSWLVNWADRNKLVWTIEHDIFVAATSHQLPN